MKERSAEFKRLHVASGWKQVRTARELDLDPSSVSLALSGKYEPSLAILRLFAGLIGDRVLLPGEDEGRSFIRDGPRWLEDWEADVITTLRRLEPGARKRITAALGEIVDAACRPASYRDARRPPTDHPPDPVPSMDALIGAAVIGVTSRPAPSPPGASDGPPSSNPLRSGVSTPAPAPEPARRPRTSSSRSAAREPGPRREI